jgi:hypothetical protein
MTTPDELNSAFGPRDYDPSATFNYDFHRGIDIDDIWSNHPVYAMETGYLFKKQSYTGFGNTIIIAHSNYQYYSVYAHLYSYDQYLPNVGDRVYEGQRLGLTGDGHLHFSILMDWWSNEFEEAAIHPMTYLPHTDANYEIVGNLRYSIANKTIECDIKIPGDILDCDEVVCWNQTSNEEVDAWYGHIAELENQDQNPVDLDEDGDYEVYFYPIDFFSNDDWQRIMPLRFYMNLGILVGDMICVYLYDDDDVAPKATKCIQVGIEETSDEEYLKGCKFSEGFPDPFWNRTHFNYIIRKKSFVNISVYDISGRTIRILLNEDKKPGYYKITWDGKNAENIKVPAGIYFCKFQTEDFSQVRKITLIR